MNIQGLYWSVKDQARSTRTGRIIWELVMAVQYLAAVVAVVIVGSLLPGDNAEIGTFAAAIGLVLLGIADAVISAPALILAYRMGRPALAPVSRTEW